MTIGERIRKLRKNLDLTTTVFGERIGITNATVSMMENGKTKVTDRTIMMIVKEFGAREEWLRTGSGKMFVEQHPDEVIAAFLGDILKDDDSFRRRFISVLAKLDDAGWAALEKQING